MRWFLGAGSKLLRPTTASHPYHTTTTTTIQAVPREHSGTRFATRERSFNRIPSLVFNRANNNGAVSNNQLLTTDRAQIDSILKHCPFFFSTTFDLHVLAGPGSVVVLQSGTVLPLRVQRDGRSGKVVNMTMAWVEKGEIRVYVPVVYKGEGVCPGLKQGGYLQKLRARLKLLCPTEQIPQKIEVDLSKLNIGDGVFERDIIIDPSVKLVRANDKRPICKILAEKPIEPELKVVTTTEEATQTSELTEPIEPELKVVTSEEATQTLELTEA